MLKRKTIALYAAAFFPFLLNTALVIAMKNRKFQVCMLPVIPGCRFTHVTLSEVSSGKK